jgi:spore germination protein YaaH
MRGLRPAWRGRSGVRRAPGRVGRASVAVAVVGAVAIVGAVLALAIPVSHGPIRLGDASQSLATPSVEIGSAAPPIPGHEVYGFVPYWEIDATIAAHLRATTTTTVALFSVTHTSKGEIATKQKGYRAISGPIGRQIVADAHELRRRVDVTWTSFGRAKNSALFASDALQERVIASLVGLRADLGVDGIAVDVEDIDTTDIPAYGAFVGRLQAALRAADPASAVTAATTAGPQGAALALAASLAGADRVFLMGYDYRTRTSEPGASAPMTRRDGLERSLGWSLDLYAAAGVPVERTLLGLPLYGLAWPTATADLGSPNTGRGDIWIPRRNLATLLDPAVAASFDPIEDVAFLAVPQDKAWQAVYYDTPQSLRPKLGLANELGLAGAGFWAVGYERGLPDYTGLIADFRAGRSMTDATVMP